MGQNLRNRIGAGLHGRPWRRIVVACALVCSLAFAGFALAGVLFAAPVSLTATGPNPKTITGNWGETLTFVNNDTVTHGITSSRPELQAPAIAPGQTFTTILTGRTATYIYSQTGTKRPPKGAVVSTVDGKVTLKSSKPEVLYGQSIQLSGTASILGTPVSLQQRLRGQRGWKQIQALTSAPDGTFTTTYTPKLGAKYRTTIAGGQIFSDLVGVTVVPKLTITPQAKKTKANHRINIYSRITPANAATKLTLLACNQYRGSWVRVGSKSPSSSGAASANLPIPVGKNYLKTTVARSNTATGFESPTSVTVTVTGIGKAPKKKAHAPKSCTA